MKKIKSGHAKTNFKPARELIRLDSNRREFIKKSTLMGAGVVACSVLPAVAIADEEEKNETKQQRGYQLTEHVIDYYKSAAS